MGSRVEVLAALSEVERTFAAFPPNPEPVEDPPQGENYNEHLACRIRLAEYQARIDAAGQAMVAILRQANIPEKPIWEDVPTGPPVEQITSTRRGMLRTMAPHKVLSITGTGWHLSHIFFRETVETPGSYTENFCVSAEGKIGTFHNRVTQGYENPVTSKKQNIVGIILPRYLDTNKHDVELAESEALKLVLANVITQKRVYNTPMCLTTAMLFPDGFRQLVLGNEQ